MNQQSNHLAMHWLDHERRDCVIICPGGGYHFTSPREAEPIVRRFQDKGYHAGVLYYRQDMLTYPNLVEEALELIRPTRHDRRVGRLIVLGFSAGGHFTGLLLKHAPDWFSAAVFCYPVIDSTHHFGPNGSMTNLMHRELTESEQHELAIDRHVNSTWPPCFIWSTTDDTLVPIDHSLQLLQSLRKHHIPTELHFYQSGPHGLALATRETPWDEGDPLEYERLYGHISTWFDLMTTWLCHVLHRNCRTGEQHD